MKEVVIKMSEEMYDWFINGFPDKADMDELQRLVITGTVLPKGHGKLIDAKHLVEEHPLAFVRDVINSATTIIEADGGDAE